MTSAIRLPVVEQGAPDGIPVVLLHGLSDSARSFEPVLGRIPSSIRAFAVSLRGHGDAEHSGDGYAVGQMAADVRAVMDEAGIVSAIVVGHSMGTIVASRLALDEPSRVAGLVLVGGKPTFDDPMLQQSLFADIGAMTDPVDAAWVRAFQESTLAEPVPAAFLDMVVDESLKIPARVWQALLETLRADFRDELPEIAAPVMLLRGGADEIATSADQDAYLDLLADARLTTYDGAGHAMHWEQPGRFAYDVTAFAVECAQARTAAAA